MTDTQSPYELGSLVRHGYKWLSFQAQNGDKTYRYDLDPARKAGLSAGVWGVTYGGKGETPDPDIFHRDGLALGRQAVDLGADHVIVDAEMCAKDTRATHGLEPIIQGLRDAGWEHEVHLCPLGAPSNPDVNDFCVDTGSFLDTGGGVLPQAYCNDYLDYMPELCVGYWTRVGVPADRINVMIGLYTGAQGRISGAEWVPLLEAAGVTRNLSVFMAQYGTETDYTGLDELTLADNPAPAADWWTIPYPRNPSPPALQQPRWLYPPDVTGGYEPSSDGPDVQAYKIAVCRLGRWPAPKNQFDQDYSNGFSHGKAGGHVADSGIEGIQRQAGLEATGNLGAKTFETLRCSLIPAGLPHAGEPALTDEAISLLTGTKWWGYPYELGPAVAKLAFPRPLYAPDWPGQPDPADGPDVLAYKRAVSMLGRWPWQQFSDTYTDELAHGKTGNVGETGVAGIQRQSPGLDDTGNLSEKLFDLLLRARVPPCLPHPHQPALDSYSIQLLHQALEQQPSGTTREQALATAVGQVGYVESPSGSNHSKYGEWYGQDYQPWCAMFVTWCYETGTAGGSGSFAKGSYYAYVPYVVSDARANRRGLSATSSPIPGDLVCYDWDGDGTYDHIGLFKSGDSSSWHAIEGNTSTGNQSNGGQVMDRSRSRYDAGAVTFVRVAE